MIHINILKNLWLDWQIVIGIEVLLRTVQPLEVSL